VLLVCSDASAPLAHGAVPGTPLPIYPRFAEALFEDGAARVRSLLPACSARISLRTAFASGGRAQSSKRSTIASRSARWAGMSEAPPLQNHHWVRSIQIVRRSEAAPGFACGINRMLCQLCQRRQTPLHERRRRHQPCGDSSFRCSNTLTNSGASHKRGRVPPSRSVLWLERRVTLTWLRRSMPPPPPRPLVSPRPASRHRGDQSAPPVWQASSRPSAGNSTASG